MGYEIEGRIGAGAMAEVFLARDTGLGRRVALKVLRGEWVDSEVCRRRLLREARVLAGLSHPNLVRVLEVGELDGRPFVAMERIEGRSFDRFLEAGPDLATVVGALERVARAIDVAHGAGVVHRDLKPSNLLVRDDGEPVVIDLGLARDEGASSGLTATDARIGTPRYMAPEQVAGGEVGPWTDVHALGAILYQALAGRPPFDEESVERTFDVIVHQRPERLGADVPRPLERVALRALEKRPADRYPSAGALADDLARWLSGRPVRAGRRRRVGPVALGALLLVAIGGPFAWWAAGRSEGRRPAPVDEPDPAPDPAPAAADDAGREGRRRALALAERGRPALDEAAAYLYAPGADHAELVARLESGRRHLEEAIEVAPDLALGHHLIGRSWEIEGWTRRAEEAYRRAIEVDAGFTPSRYRLGLLLSEKAVLLTFESVPVEEVASVLAEAIASLDRSRSDPDHLEAAIDREVAEVVLAYCRAESRRVVDLSRRAIERYGSVEGTEAFHFYLGLVLVGEARLAAYERALAIRPWDPLVLFCRGQDHHEAGRLAQAVVDYRAALELRPHFGSALVNLGNVHLSIGRGEEALELHDVAVALDPDRGSPRAARATTLLALGRPEPALADLDLAIERNGERVGWLLNRAVALAQLGRRVEARRQLDRVLELEPDSQLGLKTRAMILEMLGQPAAAIDDLDRFLVGDPRDPDARYYRARCREALGDRAGAVADLEVALAAGGDGWHYRRGAAAALARLRGGR